MMIVLSLYGDLCTQLSMENICMGYFNHLVYCAIEVYLYRKGGCVLTNNFKIGSQLHFECLSGQIYQNVCAWVSVNNDRGFLISANEFKDVDIFRSISIQDFIQIFSSSSRGKTKDINYISTGCLPSPNTSEDASVIEDYVKCAIRKH